MRKLIALCVAALALCMAGATAAQAAPGSLNPGFGSGGLASVGSNVRLFGATYQSDGKVVVVGQRGIQSGASLVVARLTAAGRLDGSFSGGIVTGPAITSQFGSGSVGRAVAVQSDGKIVVVGKAGDSSGAYAYGLLVERFNANGSLDTSFGSGGTVRAFTGSLFGDGYGVAIAPGGKIVATGSANTSGSGGTAPRAAVIRLNSNGSFDTSFGSGGTAVYDLGPYSYARAVAVQSDGKIVIAGSQSPGLQVVNALVARLTTAGGLDSSFHGGAVAKQYSLGGANSGFNALAIQSDGKIVAAGAATAGNTGAQAILARFTSGGADDGSFGSGGTVRATSAINTIAQGNSVPGAAGLVIAGNGDILAGGTATNSGLSEIAVWAFRSNGALDGSFGTGGVKATGFGNSTNGEANALAIAPDGSLATAGDVNTSGISYTGLVVGYSGFAGGGGSQTPNLSLNGVKGSYKTSDVAKHGLKVGVRCDKACTLHVSLIASAATARKLHILTKFRQCKTVHGHRRCTTVRAYRQITVAGASGSLHGAGLRTFVLRLSGFFAGALKKQKSVSLSLQVSASSPVTHKGHTVSKTVTFKR